MSWFHKPLALSCMGILAVTGGAMVTLAPPKPTPVAATPHHLAVTSLRVRMAPSHRVERTYPGVVTARRRSDLGFERGGLVRRVLVQQGDGVGEQQPLAELDVASLLARRAQVQAQRQAAAARLAEMTAGPRVETLSAAQAKVAELTSQLEMADREVTRLGRLATEQAATSKEREDATSIRAIAQAQLDQASHALAELRAGARAEQLDAQQALVAQLDAALAELTLEEQRSVLRAPFAGHIAQRLVDEGTVIGPGQPVMSLVEGGVLEARVGVPLAAATTLALGSEQTLIVSGVTVPGVVARQSPVLDERTRTVQVTLTLSPPTTGSPSGPSSLLPGAVARLRLTEDRPGEGCWLPNAALLQGTRGLWDCYALVEDPAQPGVFRCERRLVEVLHADGDQSFVRGTLAEGERVVADGTHRVTQGQRVTLAP